VNVVELLKAARSKIAVGYCRDMLAANKFGQPVLVRDTSACRWCMWGALLDITDLGSIDPLVVDAGRYLALAINYECQATTYHSLYTFVSLWADVPGRSQGEALSVYDAAIAMAEADAAEDAGIEVAA